MSRLLVISNRLPSPGSDASAGGLAVALHNALSERDGLWLGWSGEAGSGEGHEIDIREADGFRIAALDLSEEEVSGYYFEFANRCLWPVLHYRLDLAQYSRENYDIYRAVNAKFADAAAELAEDGDTIWVHDFHLIPLCRALRSHRSDVCVGFFLHTPFPAPAVFAALPWANELATDLLSYDIIGFQTEECAENFRGYLRHFANGAVAPDKRVSANGQTALTGVFPIGIDPDNFAEIAASPEAMVAAEELRHNFNEVMLLAGVERLDYSKGIIEHLQAFAHLLETHPDYQGRLFLCQIAAPSRVFIPEYEAIGHQVEEMAGHINGRFGTFEWTPLHFISRPVSRPDVAGLCRASKVGLVTPLRDGMNLVAKEYVAAQDPADPGALVLSSFAGAAVELTDALLVNPRDTEQTADAIRQAIEMPLAERRERWERMMERLRSNDIHHWCNAFLGELDEACRQTRRAAYGS